MRRPSWIRPVGLVAWSVLGCHAWCPSAVAQRSIPPEEVAASQAPPATTAPGAPVPAADSAQQPAATPEQPAKPKDPTDGLFYGTLTMHFADGTSEKFQDATIKHVEYDEFSDSGEWAQSRSCQVAPPNVPAAGQKITVERIGWWRVHKLTWVDVPMPFNEETSFAKVKLTLVDGTEREVFLFHSNATVSGGRPLSAAPWALSVDGTSLSHPEKGRQHHVRKDLKTLELVR
jgi:hypothetical protein